MENKKPGDIMLTKFRCKKHNEIMREKIISEEILPYCVSCKAERQFHEKMSDYMDNQNTYEIQNRRHKRKKRLEGLCSGLFGVFFVCMIFINIFTVLSFFEFSLWISAFLSIMFTLWNFHHIWNIPDLHEKPLFEKELENLKKLSDLYDKDVNLFIQKLADKYTERSIEMEKIDQMTGLQFEGYVANLLRQTGYKEVTLTKASGDQGLDIIAKGASGVKIGFQCKRFNSKVGNKAIQEANAGKGYHGCKKAIVVTNSYFTEPAYDLARKLHVELWSRKRLIEEMKKVKVTVSWEDFLRSYYAEPFKKKKKLAVEV